jgi:hypothetical protein
MNIRLRRSRSRSRSRDGANFVQITAQAVHFPIADNQHPPVRMRALHVSNVTKSPAGAEERAGRDAARIGAAGGN